MVLFRIFFILGNKNFKLLIIRGRAGWNSVDAFLVTMVLLFGCGRLVKRLFLAPLDALVLWWGCAFRFPLAAIDNLQQLDTVDSFLYIFVQ